MDDTVARARSLAEALLADALPQRWAHTQGVARQARSLAGQLGDDAGLVEAAAWLHDIGYAPEVAVTGFHPLDGARYLADVDWVDSVLCELVAHHSGAAFEAEERGMATELAAFGPPGRHERLVSAVTAADMTTTTDGLEVSAGERIAEILLRYPCEDAVHRAVMRSGTNLISTTQQVLNRIGN